MKLHDLSTFQLEILSLADTGAEATVSEVVHGMHTPDPLDWLQHRFLDFKFGRWSTYKHDPKVAEELNDALMRHANALSGNDVGVTESGVLYLAAVITNIIQSEEWSH